MTKNEVLEKGKDAIRRAVASGADYIYVNKRELSVEHLRAGWVWAEENGLIDVRTSDDEQDGGLYGYFTQKARVETL